MFFLLLFAGVFAHATPELCNGVDDDGDGLIDEPPVLWFPDTDGDGFGDRTAAVAAASCDPLAPPAGWVADGSDCDDGNADVRPGAAEICNGVDDDCDGEIDEGVCGTCDRHQSDRSVFLACDEARSWSDAGQTCTSFGYHLVIIDDPSENAFVTAALPGAAFWWIGLEDSGNDDWFWVDGVPLDPNSANWGWRQPFAHWNNCVHLRADSGEWYNWSCDVWSPFVCEAECPVHTVFADADGDGFGDPGTATETCWPEAGQVFNDLDCAVADPSITRRVFYLDADGDLFGDDDLTVATVDCTAPYGFAAQAGDCEPDNDAISPGAPEVCNGIDDDCDGLVDDLDPDLDLSTASSWWMDEDGDGYGAGEAIRACEAPEGTVGIDGDCDDDDPAVYPGTPGCDAPRGDTATTSTTATSNDRAPSTSESTVGDIGQPGCGCAGATGGPGGALLGILIVRWRRARVPRPAAPEQARALR